MAAHFHYILELLYYYNIPSSELVISTYLKTCLGTANVKASHVQVNGACYPFSIADEQIKE